MPALRGGPVSPSQEALGNCPKAVQCLWWGKGLSESGAHQVQQPHFCDPVRACLPLTARPLRVPLGESLLPRLPPAWIPVFCPVWLPCAIPSHPGVSSLTPGCPACSSARPTLMLGLSLQCLPEELSSGRGAGRQGEPPPGSKDGHVRPFLPTQGSIALTSSSSTTLTEPCGGQSQNQMLAARMPLFPCS